MHEHQWMAEQFEENRTHLRAVAYRMLGDLSEADDAVQEAWLHLSRAERSDVKNMSGWLTTVVARICLDMLRTRKSRREDSLDTPNLQPVTSHKSEADPEHEALLADSVGLALLVVLNTLSPAERLAFVLHDIFAMPFDEIAQVIDRSEMAARQLASRARRRVRGGSHQQHASLQAQRVVVDAFLAAAREGDFEALLTLLDPNVVFRHDPAALPADAKPELLGPLAVAKQFAGRAQAARSVLVNGEVGVVVAPYGSLRLVLQVTVANGMITAINAILDPKRLQQLHLVALSD